MRQSWVRFRANAALFFATHKKLFRRVYWVIAIVAFVVLVSAPLLINELGIGPEQGIFAPHPVSDELREIMREGRAIHREMNRMGDFAYLLANLSENYPFLEMIERRGIDVRALATDALDELAEVARYGLSPTFFLDFINENFIEHLGRTGGLHVISEAGRLPSWVVQPYFFGHYDWRFTDERFYVPIGDANHSMGFLAENAAYLQVHNFLAKGYTEGAFQPIWNFMHEDEAIAILGFYEGLEVENLVIDIRGIDAGFAEYFLPLIVEPNIEQYLSVNFYGFHANAPFANNVSENLRNFYSFGNLVDAAATAANMPYANPDDFALLSHGFNITLDATPLSDSPAFGGQIWLLVDSYSLSGLNQIFVYLAQQAGFLVIYQENPAATGWAASLNRLPQSNLSLRYNPIYFTDTGGRALEEFPLIADFLVDSLEDVAELFRPPAEAAAP
ncbi:MAG: hypothetical protein LBE35_11325 [Clostridiales bacterium]|jgi:hypothetical protein|nr:hypothetical protein [Clostridiales bacterium]